MTRLSRVLQAWIDNDKDVTWDKMIKVLESATVDNVAKANEIKSFVRQGVPVVAAPQSTGIVMYSNFIRIDYPFSMASYRLGLPLV
jgi:hypothetical protein